MDNAAANTVSTLQEVQKRVVAFLTEYGFQIIGALIILSVGAFIARWVGRRIGQWLEKKHVELPVRVLVVRVIRLLLFGLAVVLALEKCGVPIAPMIAGISVAGVGLGLAMQGVLGNLVAGLSIIFTKPYRIGEYISLLGVEGQVAMIELFSTTLVHSDRSRVIVPNRKIVGEVLHNYGAIRQLELTVGVAYGTDLDRALAIAQGVLNAHPRVLKDPAPVMGIVALADSAINLSIRPWSAVSDFGSTHRELYKQLVEEFRANRIEIPVPQREVRLLNQV